MKDAMSCFFVMAISHLIVLYSGMSVFLLENVASSTQINVSIDGASTCSHYQVTKFFFCFSGFVRWIFCFFVMRFVFDPIFKKRYGCRFTCNNVP